VVFPILAPELVRARTEELRHDAAPGLDGRSGGGPRPVRPERRWRLALGNRLVAMGTRLLGEPQRTMEVC
jgi:hypothetical protein